MAHHLGGDGRPEDNIAMLMQPATAEGRVMDMMALLYANACGTPSERLAYAAHRDRTIHPYRAWLASRNRREREGHFICGGNPYLYARLVEQVTVESTETGTELLHWREIDP
jgi:hypothetical protein